LAVFHVGLLTDPDTTASIRAARFELASWTFVFVCPGRGIAHP
jgi:hypothetical protein